MNKLLSEAKAIGERATEIVMGQVSLALAKPKASVSRRRTVCTPSTERDRDEAKAARS